MVQEQKIRVLRLISRMNVGGPAIQIAGIENGINGLRFDHILVTGECDESEIDYLSSHNFNFKVEKISGLGKRIKIVDDFRTFLKLRQLIRKFNPDIVHTHTAKAGTLGRLVCLFSNRNIFLVHTFHGHLLSGYFGKFTTWMIILVERFLAKRSDVLISVGKKTRDELLDVGIGDLSKYRIINPGCELSKIPRRDEVVHSLGLNPRFRYVSWLGRIVKIKRPDRLIEIAHWLKDNYPDVRILVAGDGPLRKEVEKKASQSDLPIQFLGWVLNIESVLAVSEIMILTSDNEGTPLSLIQAQLAGLPVVATDVGSTSEIVANDETGFIVPMSVELFNKAIGTLLQDEEKARLMGQRARIRALELYSVERLVRDHEKIYLELMSSVQPISRPKL